MPSHNSREKGTELALSLIHILAHGMEHPASGLKDITHGVGLAVIEPVVVEYTWSANPDKFGALARIFNHGDGSELGEALRFIVHDLDLTTNLTEPVSYTHLGYHVS